jgi:hypothetical protein
MFVSSAINLVGIAGHSLEPFLVGRTCLRQIREGSTGSNLCFRQKISHDANKYPGGLQLPNGVDASFIWVTPDSTYCVRFDGEICVTDPNLVGGYAGYFTSNTSSSMRFFHTSFLFVRLILVISVHLVSRTQETLTLFPIGRA